MNNLSYNKIVSLILLVVIFSAHIPYSYVTAQVEGESEGSSEAAPAQSSESGTDSSSDSQESAVSDENKDEDDTESSDEKETNSDDSVSSDLQDEPADSPDTSADVESNEVEVDTSSVQSVADDEETENTPNENVPDQAEIEPEAITPETESENEDSEEPISAENEGDSNQTTASSDSTSTSTADAPIDNKDSQSSSSSKSSDVAVASSTENNSATTTYATTTEQISATTSQATTSEAVNENIPAPENILTSTSTEIASTTATSTATTTINHGTSTPTIISGTSVALANILNLVNTNLINSDGVFLFSNFFESVMGSLDFRGAFENIQNGCGLGPCTNGENIAIHVENEGSIDNDITIQANSGQNSIGEAGSAAIDTGDAYAGLNLINFANTNVVDSEYLVVTVNAFQNIQGDVVFPSLSQFFSSLVGGSSNPTDVQVTGTAVVDNNIDVQASSGDNQTSAHESEINSGNAISTANVFNGLNTTLVGGQSVSILFKVHGNWAGNVFGAPPGLSWTEGDDGSIYLFDTTSGDTHAMGEGSTTVHASSTGYIRNNVTVTALTGENEITNSNTALISTGNALAGANIVNVANQNIISRNWILAVINIFGDFNGNIAFGRPDMWIGQQVETPSKIKDGSTLTYKVTVINNGDSEATDAIITNTFDDQHLEIIESTQQYTHEGSNKMKWNIPALPAGAAIEIVYTARIKDAGYNREITTEATVVQKETDNNNVDNTDTITVETEGRNRSKKIPKEPSRHTLKSVDFSVQRLTENSTSTRTVEIPQKLIVKNSSTFNAENIVLNDFVRDSTGKIIKHETWELGTILAGEEITIEYNINFAADAPLGSYSLSTIFTDKTAEYIKFIDNGKIVLIEDFVPIALLPVQPIKISKQITPIDVPVENHELPLAPHVAEAAEINTAAVGGTSQSSRILWSLGATILAGLYVSLKRFYI